MTTSPPWHTDPECGDESVLGPDGIMVADCAIFSRWRASEDNRANAKLIAAAPDLLAAAKAVIDERDAYLMPDQPDTPDGTVESLYNSLRDDIAEAEGSGVAP